MNQQPRRRTFGSFFSSRSFKELSITRSDTPPLAIRSSSTSVLEDEKGPLGLTTLYDPEPPASPVADIVFIHGLGGGSRKTWSYSSDPFHYWPKSWLSTDKDFGDVRIHAFGYNADWSEIKQSVLDIGDFAQSLLGALRNHPGIRRTSTRIILVGHSMGGCVAKKMYILSREDATAADIARRVHSMFFLATPHHGSDMAATLQRLLAVTWNKKPFVGNLTPFSAALEAINNTFRHYALDLHLWSFYETLPMRGAGVMSRIVVDKHSARLGYPKEQIAAMDADHRQICKFKMPDNPNYMALRNALLTAVDLIRATAPDSSEEVEPVTGGPVGDISVWLPEQPSIEPSDGISLLRSFLRVRDLFESNLAELRILRQPGSCRWFTGKEPFTSWAAGTGPGILWLVGKPGAGKSILASHVIDLLKSLKNAQPDIYCSYFIFKHGKFEESGLSECFRSLAFQMATQDELVRAALLGLHRDGVIWDNADDVTVWRRLFHNCIFKLRSVTRHFWVLDGVDECAQFSALFSKRFLSALPEGLRMFATSRRLEAIERGLVSLGTSRVNLQVLSDADTRDDIRLFVSTALAELGRHDSEENCRELCERVLSKSSGSFLWTRLMMQEFEGAWTVEAMEAALGAAPSPTDLFGYYARMLQAVEADKRKAALAKSILTWVVMGSRPFTVDELRCAVKLDLNQTLSNAAMAIPELCGHLVYVDQGHRVQLIHETVQDFLLSGAVGLGISVDTQSGHAHCASLLLGYLSGQVWEPKPVKPQRRPGPHPISSLALGSAAASGADTSLLDYASVYFSEHLCQANAADEQLIRALCSFLWNTSILSWMEHIAESGDLNKLGRASTNLGVYLARRIEQVPSTDPDVRDFISDWATDLLRVPGKFRDQLLTCPSSIHDLIPPLCPSESILFRTFCKGAPPTITGRQLTVKGLAPSSWGDCLTILSWSGEAVATDHGDMLFAIGLENGKVLVYDASSLHCAQELKHPERVRIVRFSPHCFWLATSGDRHLIVWDPKSGVLVHSFQLLPVLNLVGLIFVGTDELLGVFPTKLTKWNLTSKQRREIHPADCCADERGRSEDIDLPAHMQGAYEAVFHVTADRVLLALGYRYSPVCVWDALQEQFLGHCSAAPRRNRLLAMAFGPNPELPVLVLLYNDYDLFVFNYETMQREIAEHYDYPEYTPNCITFSPSGRCFAIASGYGGFEVFALQRAHNGTVDTLTMTCICRIRSSGSMLGLGFSSDGLRILDVCLSKARVWAPAVLARTWTDESVRSIPGLGKGVLVYDQRLSDFPDIQCPPVISKDGHHVVAGNNLGEVVLFRSSDAAKIGLLYKHEHQGACIIALVTSQSQTVLASLDDRRYVKVVSLEAPISEAATMLDRANPRVVVDRCFDPGYQGPFRSKLLMNGAGNRLLIIGNHANDMLLWELPSCGRAPRGADLDTDNEVKSTVIPLTSGDQRCFAFQHPAKSDWFVAMKGEVARVYSWNDGAELTSAGGIRLKRKGALVPNEHYYLYTDVSYIVQSRFVLELLGTGRDSFVFVWPTDAFNPLSEFSAAEPLTVPNFGAVGPPAPLRVTALLGMGGPSTLVFLDLNRWICSIDLQSVTGALTLSLRKTGLEPSAKQPPRDPPRGIQRHFFAPLGWKYGMVWCTQIKRLPPLLDNGSTYRDIIVFADDEHLLVIHDGLTFDKDVFAPRTSR
ncbi:hypothetical protein VTK26DRAFT_4213 [Humicola hyalothermophila]